MRVAEVSVNGLLVAHEGKLPPGETRTIRIEAPDAPFEMDVTIARSTLYRLGRDLRDPSIYRSGMRIISFANDSFQRLRLLIGDRILRALEEQKANAHGIPPLSAYMYQPEKGELYRRCELIDGTWRKSETIRTTQPPNGFTISAEVDPVHVQMLCATWETTTAEGRRLTQLFAQLSISRSEGIPTRRYVP